MLYNCILEILSYLQIKIYSVQGAAPNGQLSRLQVLNTHTPIQLLLLGLTLQHSGSKGVLTAPGVLLKGMAHIPQG